MSLKRKVEQAFSLTTFDDEKQSRSWSPAEIEISMWQPPPSVLPKSSSTSRPKIIMSDSLSSASAESDGIIKPHENDVLCRRGGRLIKNPGNIFFRKLIDSKRKLYKARSQEYKTSVAMSVVDTICRQEPPGRFLCQDVKTGLWFDLGKIKAIQKTSVALALTRKAPGKTTTQEQEKREVTDNESNGDDQEEKCNIGDIDESDKYRPREINENHQQNLQQKGASEDSAENDEISELTNEDNFVPLPYFEQEEKPGQYDNDFVNFMNTPQILHALFDGDSLRSE